MSRLLPHFAAGKTNFDERTHPTFQPYWPRRTPSQPALDHRGCCLPELVAHRLRHIHFPVYRHIDGRPHALGIAHRIFACPNGDGEPSVIRQRGRAGCHLTR